MRMSSINLHDILSEIFISIPLTYFSVKIFIVVYDPCYQLHSSQHHGRPDPNKLTVNLLPKLILKHSCSAPISSGCLFKIPGWDEYLRRHLDY